ncbi:MAG TPA: hypothetical protein VG817_01205 [Gemmatimonadales bacterium]|nr:hypothetical protein [Gemmatimonadales bacterium]
MISPVLATLIVALAALYLVAGALFAIPFATRWAGRLDPVAANGTIGFRLLLLPGAILLWPLLLARLRRSHP